MKNKVLFYFSASLLVAVFQAAQAQSDNPWGYLNMDDSLLPADWYKFHPKCNGTRQSPIDIHSTETMYNSSMKRIQFKREMCANQTQERWTIENNGFSCKLEYSFCQHF
jgi:carbonic anhydrase